MNERVLPPNRDCYETPSQFFKRLDDEFRFDVDAFAGADNTKKALFFSEHRSAFHADWAWRSFGVGAPTDRPLSVFCNPPYSQGILGRAVTRMADQSVVKGALVVGVVPPSIDTKWWHEVVMRYAAEVRFVQGRLSFEYRGVPLKGNAGGTCVIVFRPGVSGPLFRSMKAVL